MTTVTKYAVDGPIILHHIVGILRTKDGKVTVESNYNLIRILLIRILLVFHLCINALPFFFLMPLTTSKAGLAEIVFLKFDVLLCRIYIVINEILKLLQNMFCIRTINLKKR